MPGPHHHLVSTLICLSSITVLYAQDSSDTSKIKVPSRYFDNISKKTSSLSASIDKKSIKLLSRLQKQEERLRKIISIIDPENANNIFSGMQQQYEQLSGVLNGKIASEARGISGEYMPYYDSLQGSLSFLKGNKNRLNALQSEKLTNAMNKVNQFESKLQQADQINQFIKQRKQQIADLLSRYTSLPPAASKIFGKYKSAIFYYGSQIKEYKETWRDPDKLQRSALTLLNKIPAFREFIKQHSQLGGLFSMPDNYDNALALSGLQTRDQVQQSIAGQLGGGGNISQVLGQQVQVAQSQLDQFKQKLNVLGGGSGDIDMPDFKPRNQRTKTFLQRLEYGTNLQSTRSTYFYPSVTDIGLSIAYRIGDKNLVGLGTSFKIGWGKDIKHIAITGQGIGLRSFVDIKIKKSFFASGGFEYNFQQPFDKLQQLYDIDSWQKSGLIGITKIVSVKSKLFKKTRLQLLWDVLSYQQRPRSEQFKFRVGYSFN